MSSPSRLPRLALALLMTAMLLMLATVPLDWKDQAVLGAVLFVAALFISKRFAGERATSVLIVISLFCATRYFWWRVTETIQYFIANGSQVPLLDIFFVVLLLGAEAYAVVILVLGYFQNARPLRRKPAPLPDDLSLWPSVDILIPTYNEPLEIVRTTMLGAMNIDWPRDRLNVYILDDGKRVEVHRLAEEAGCAYIARLDNVGAKAGNINHALARTTGEFVAIFDSDHVPTRSFLQLTMGWFGKDPRLAMVQTPHHFYSPDPFEKNLGTFRKVPNEEELFYGTLQDGNDFWNGMIFCGSCAVLRRSALDEVGGIATETVTEDSHTSLRLLKLGWNTAYINIPQAAGLAASNVSDHIGQRIRWARGMVQILRMENPLFAKGLTWPQRLCYFNATIHFLHAIPRLVFLTAPLVFLLLGRSNVYGYSWAILAYVIPYVLMATLTNSRAHGKFRHSFWNEVFETLLAPYILVPTVLALVNPRWGKFNVTPKGALVHKKYFDFAIATPFLVLFGLNVAGLISGLMQTLSGIEDNGTILVNLTWTLFNTLILGATLAVPWESRQTRSAERIPLRMPIRLRKRNGVELNGFTLDISTSGTSLQLDTPGELNVNDGADLIFHLSGEEYALPVQVRRSRGLVVGLQFQFTSLLEHEALVRVIFGRADSWVNWGAGRHDDRLLWSFGRVLWVALRGIALLPKGLISSPPSAVEEEPEALPEALPEAGAPSVLRGRVVPLSVLLIAAVLLAIGVARANEPFAETRDWAELGHRQPITFQAGEGRVNLAFTVPLTKLVTHGTLVVQYKSSGGFRDGSALNVSLNGVALTSINPQVKPGAAGVLQQVEIPLPSDLVVSENTLALQLAATCQGGCKDRVHWVQVDPLTTIRLSGEMLPLPDSLRVLPAPFVDSTTRRMSRVTMVLGGEMRNETLEAAGVVASWLGAIADDRGSQFTVRTGSIQRGNAIVFATSESELIRSLGLEAVQGPEIAIRTNPLDPFGKLLVITGRTGAELRTAAQILAAGNFPKDGDRAALTGIRVPPPAAAYDAPRWLNPLRSKGLGESLSPEMLRWYGAGAVNLYFRLPPDLAFGQRSTVPLRLGFRTTASVEQSGELRVTLNGGRVSTTRFTISEGATSHHRTVYLPVPSLYTGNTLTIEFHLNAPANSAASSYPEINVLPNSSIELRGIPRFVRLPRLDLFANAGFPFTRLADLSGTAVLLPDNPTTDEVACYLGLLGRFGGQTGSPTYRVTVLGASEARKAQDKELLVIGSTSDHPLFQQWAAHLPVSINEQLRPNKPPGLWSLLADLPFTTTGREYRRLSDTLFEGASPEGVVQAIASPLDSRRNAVLVAVGDQQNFDFFMQSLHSSASKDVKGSVALFSNGRFQSFEFASTTTHLGELSLLESFYTWVGRNFFLIVFVVIGFAIPLSRWFAEWCDQHAAVRLQGSR
ncbi:MAG: UDP-forming cellulose synthase catalytic subunit [Bryobacterales bacterium]|nr:UDP-forming cellulose synthase catalytic subunit [Bryobacterales bacterium]